MHQLLDHLTASTVRSFYLPCVNSLFEFHRGEHQELFNWKEFVASQSKRQLQINELRKINDQGYVNDHYKTEYARQLFRVWAVIEFGLYNAANTTWSLLSVIPLAFFQGRSRWPSPEETLQIIGSTENLTHTLASGQDNVFTYVAHQLREGPSKTPWPPYSPSKFTVTGDNRLTIRGEVFKPPSNRAPTESLENNQEVSLDSDDSMFVRAGCPGIDLIKVVQKSCNKVAAEGLVDLIDALKNLPLTDKTYPSSTLEDVQFIPNSFMPPFDDLD